MGDAHHRLLLISTLAALCWAPGAVGAPSEEHGAQEASTTPSVTTTNDRPSYSIIGEEVAQRCAACHALEPGAKDQWGPSLVGIVGKPMGSVPGYRYGPYLRAQRASGAAWDEVALRAWLGDSKAVAKAAGARTKMPAQDLSPREFDALIVYLRRSQ